MPVALLSIAAQPVPGADEALAIPARIEAG
jgi:hypothetical protein